MPTRVRPNAESIQAAFEEAVNFVRSLPPNDGQMDISMQLSVYGLYKCATAGAPTASSSMSFDVKSNFKKDAWNDAWVSCNMNPQVAKQEYVQLIRDLRNRFNE